MLGKNSFLLPVANNSLHARTPELTPLSPTQLTDRTTLPVVLFWTKFFYWSLRKEFKRTEPCPYKCVFSEDRQRYAKTATVRVLHLRDLSASVS